MVDVRNTKIKGLLCGHDIYLCIKAPSYGKAGEDAESYSMLGERDGGCREERVRPQR